MRIYPVKRPLCAMILAFIAGLWLSNVSSLLVGGCVFLCLAGAVGYALRLREPRLVLLCLGAALAGFLLMSHTISVQESLAPAHGQEVRIQAEVVRAPDNRRYVDVRVQSLDGHSLTQPVNLRVSRDYKDHAVYECRGVYAFSGALRAPLDRTNPGGYDEATLLAQRGIYSVLDAEEPGTHLEPPPAWAQGVNRLKALYTEILDRYLNPGEQALIAATLFGDVSDLSEDFYMASQQFGIIHIFSVSGLHVTFILGFILALAKLLRRQHSWGLVVLLIPLLTLYTLLSDASAPAIRASLMGVLTLLALRLLRYRDPLTIVALSALMLLIANPTNLWQIGFQLSFLAMLGLIVLPPRLLPLLRRLPQGLADAIAMSLAAELVSIPLVAYYFYTVSPLSTVMNLLVVPFFSLLVPLALVALLLAGLLPGLGALFFLPVKMIITAIVALMNVIYQVAGTMHFHVGQPPLWLVVLYYLVLVTWVLIPLTERRAQGMLLFGTVALVAALCLRPAAPDNLRLAMLDVGQGTGCAAQSADGDWLIFDTGPGADTMAQSLRYYGVDTIEAIVLSHSDSDHIGGCAHLLRDFRVKQLIASPYAQTTEEWKALTPYLKDTTVVTIDTPRRFVAGDAISLECTLLDESKSGEENQNQVVARLTMGPTRFLFTGDSNADVLETLPWREGADVVVVPHHGSKNSWNEAFYRMQDPRLALISAGRANRYGHPHREVTEGLAALSIPTRCTTQSGAILLCETADGLAVAPFVPSYAQ